MNLHWHSTERRQPAAPVPATCSATTSGHDAVNPKPYLLVVGRKLETVVLCDGCREVYQSMGLPLSPERRSH